MTPFVYMSNFSAIDTNNVLFFLIVFFKKTHQYYKKSHLFLSKEREIASPYAYIQQVQAGYFICGFGMIFEFILYVKIYNV